MSPEIPAELLPTYDTLAVTAITVTPTLIGVALSATSPTASCPGCQTPSAHIHSRYRRTVADRPIAGRSLVLNLRVRKFRCSHPGCERQVFCERLPAVLAPYARSTAILTDLHRLIGFALGGEPGSRLAGKLAMPTSGDTLLRRITTAPDGPEPVYRFVGLDDFALRKGQVYGTILIDLERGRVIDLFDGRDGAPVEAWLKAHPGVEVITRDRWPAYANAAAAGAPTATQVADRFHLVKNLRELVEKLFETHAAALDETLNPAPVEPTPPAEPVASSLPDPTPREPSASQRRRNDRFEQVRRLRAEGRGIRRIARELGMSVKTVCRYLRQDRCPDWNPGHTRPSRLDRYRDQVDAYIRDGGRQAAELHRRLRAEGCRVSYHAVRRFFNRRLAATGLRRERRNAARLRPAPRPTARQLSFEYVRRAAKRTLDEANRMTKVCEVSGLADELKLVDEFLGMTRQTNTTPLTDWLTRAEHSANASVRLFAASLRTDEAAVVAGLTTGWSNGPVEGQVGRLKLIKRSMYGRAGLRLLRARLRAKR